MIVAIANSDFADVTFLLPNAFFDHLLNSLVGSSPAYVPDYHLGSCHAQRKVLFLCVLACWLQLLAAGLNLLSFGLARQATQVQGRYLQRWYFRLIEVIRVHIVFINYI